MKSKRVRDEPRRFVLTKFLGAGTYNCAYHLTEEENVLRIGFLPYWDRDPNVKRGLKIVHVFQSFQNKLGPSLLQEISKYQIIDVKDLKKHVDGSLCLRLVQTMSLPENIITSADLFENPDARNEFALQHIEYLRGGVFSATSLDKNSIALSKNEVCFFTFSLLWFFAMSQQLFSFRHHDLKGDNIMIRTTNDMKTYAFEITEQTPKKKSIRYEFLSHFVPVVIDYDFGTVYQKNTQNARNSGGTFYTRAPDALLFSLYEESMREFDFTYNPHVYDYWSVGISLFELLCNFSDNIWNLFGEECKEFTQEVFSAKFFPKRTTREFVYYFFYGLCFINAVSTQPFETSLQPLKEMYGSFVDTIDWEHWDNRIHKESDDYKELVGAFQNDFPDDLKEIVRKLLHVNPSERNAYNKPMNLILQSNYFESYISKTKAKAQQGSFKGENNPVLSDEELVQKSGKDSSFLEGKVCSVCFVEANLAQTFYLCECCAKPFCGVECQIKKH